MTTTTFEKGNLGPGIYKIQNIYTETFLDIEIHSREVCCRPKRDLGEGRGLWEIKRLGDGYTIQRVDPGRPAQFCTPLKGVQNGSTLSVTSYPIPWRVKIVDDEKHRGFEYVRFHWATSNIVWDLAGSNRRNNGARVEVYGEVPQNYWQIWSLIPMTVGGAPMPPRQPPEAGELGPLPLYEEAPGQPPVRAQNVEYERDELGTVVNEVTAATTRRRFRVEDA